MSGGHISDGPNEASGSDIVETDESEQSVADIIAESKEAASGEAQQEINRLNNLVEELRVAAAVDRQHIEKLQSRKKVLKDRVVYEKDVNNQLNDRLRGERVAAHQKLGLARKRFDELRDHVREQAQDLGEYAALVVRLHDTMSAKGIIITKDMKIDRS